MIVQRRVVLIHTVAHPAGDERGDGKGERHREAGEAEVERDRVGDHARCLPAAG